MSEDGCTQLVLTETAGFLFAVVCGSLAFAFAVHNLVRAVLDLRVDRWRRLLEAAAVAVRKTDAAVVRPILGARMVEAIALAEQRYAELAPYPPRYRLHLLTTLERSVSLTDAEREHALQTALTFLVQVLRQMPAAPIVVRTDEDVERHTDRLRYAIEVSCHSSHDAIADQVVRGVAEFCRGGVAE